MKIIKLKHGKPFDVKDLFVVSCTTTQDEIWLEIKISHTTSKQLCEITDLSHCYRDYKELRQQRIVDSTVDQIPRKSVFDLKYQRNYMAIYTQQKVC